MKMYDRKLRLATPADEPSPEYLGLWGLDEQAQRVRAHQAHREALKSFLRSASALAKRPDLMSKGELLAIRHAEAAIHSAVAARAAAGALESCLLEEAA